MEPIMNIPNRLTVFRVVLIPAFMVFAAQPPGWLYGPAYVFIREHGMAIGGAVFLIAFATDFLDGYIARKYDLVTDFGKFMDPIADKLLVAAALVALMSRSAAGPWVTLTILAREFIVTGMRLLAAGKGIVLAAGGLGKAKTFTQAAALALLLFGNLGAGFLRDINAGGILLYAAAVLTIVSGADYIIKNRSLFL